MSADSKHEVFFAYEYERVDAYLELPMTSISASAIDIAQALSTCLVMYSSQRDISRGNTYWLATMRIPILSPSSIEL